MAEQTSINLSVFAVLLSAHSATHYTLKQIRFSLKFEWLVGVAFFRL